MTECIYKHILVMTDFSEDSLNAVRVAANIAKFCGSKITILHVAHDESQIKLYLNTSEYEKVREKIDIEIEEQLQEIHKEVPALDELNAKHVIRRGIPYVEGLLEIEKGDYDLVVIGSHGKTSIKKFFYGSTAEKIARRAPISVLVTRIKQ
ncbi:universal stress protein [Deferribacter autotrophicus]|uniref:Universal stress protein n=1 Tax=Deferribacter autotrophicus TaxID=500465 RepID=A0A5A8F8J9_9BACT|nr:universal stress protein [Deferribacter autotrophicus]KAA0258603.1 universal stress protein [Deferribacter autotrophicus]